LDYLPYIALIYFVAFWWQVIKNPFSIATAESIDHDFPIMVHSGRAWRKGKIPEDKVFFRHLTGIKTGVFYPPNILGSWLSSFGGLDYAWKIYVTNVLLHHWATVLCAFLLFGGGLVGLFGAIAWGFMSYHIKSTLWYAQTFTWITATILALEHNQFWLAGICLGMLILSGHAPFVLYFSYALVGWGLMTGKATYLTLLVGFLIGLPQIIPYYRYQKLNISAKYTAQEKTEIGSLPGWAFLFMFLPIRLRAYVGKIGHEEWCFYVGPLIMFFALFGKGSCWLLFWLSIMLSLGGGVYVLFSKFLIRMPYRIGYFTALATVVLGVDGLRTCIQIFQLNNQHLALLCVLLGITMWFSRDFILLEPFNGYGERPSKTFKTPLLEFLEANSGGHKVNNLPFPVYAGLINRLNVLPYTGGNHDVSVGNFLKVPKLGHAPYDWFYWNEDSDIVDMYDIGWHVGYKPSDDPKWMKVPCQKALWVNKNVVRVN